jgi:transcriptional regulator GlxA family with amidase domain
MTGRQAGEYFRFLGASVERPLLHLSDNREILAAFEETWAPMKTVHTVGNLVLASTCLTRYLGAVRRAMSAAEARTRAVDQRIQETIAFVTANLSAEVSLAELANLARLSVSRYTAVFRRATGCSPTEYFGRLRVQRACEMLRTTIFPIHEIARQTGYLDPYYFSRAFKKQVGVSPTAFRKG